MKGLKAMEMRTERSYSAPATNSIINPSGMYGLKVLDNKGVIPCILMMCNHRMSEPLKIRSSYYWF